MMGTHRTTAAVTAWFAVSLMLAGTANAQSATGPPTLRAAAGPPAEVREMQQSESARDPVGRMNRDHVLRALEELEPGSTKPENLRKRQGKPLAGASQVPEQVRAAQQVERGRPPTVPTRESLLEEIRGMPGGPEALEEAKRRGAKIGANRSRPGQWLAWLNPLRVREARAEADYSVVLTPINPRQSSPYASLTAYGAFASGSGNSTRWTLRNWTVNKNGVETRLVGPQAFVAVDIPTSGWHVINYRGYHRGSKAQLVHEPYPGIVQTWGFVNGNTYRNYPVVVYLDKGWHSLSFFVTKGSLMLTSVSIYSL